MFWNKKPKPNPNDDIRELLFADLPIEKWGEKLLRADPQGLFFKANKLLETNQKQEAISILEAVTQMADLESRHHAQAYHFLRSLGQHESEPTKLFGVVTEVGIKRNGYDLLAAYTDLKARYYNYSGSAVIWENPDDSLQEEITAVLQMGEEVMKRIGPWKGTRPKPVKRGVVRLNLITSKGLHFGEGPIKGMDTNPLGGGLLNASFVLMEALMKKARK